MKYNLRINNFKKKINPKTLARSQLNLRANFFEIRSPSSTTFHNIKSSTGRPSIDDKYPETMHSAGLKLRKSGAIVIFIIVLIGVHSHQTIPVVVVMGLTTCFPFVAYTIQTELAQHVQNDLGFRKPYLLLYITHTGYSLILPLHLLVLKLMGISIPHSLSTLRGVLRLHFASLAVATRSVVQSARSPSISSSSATTVDQQQQYFPNGISNLLSTSSGGTRISRRSSMKSLLAVGERGRLGGKGAWKWNLGSTVICLTLLIAAPALTWYAAVPLTSMTGELQTTPFSIAFG